jgi:hypothetical protein
MTWTLTCDVAGVNRFTSSVACAVKEVFITPSPDSLSCYAINMGNTICVDSTFSVCVEGDMEETPIDIQNLSSVLPPSGTAKVTCDRGQMVINVDKTRFKFPVFSKAAVRKPNRLTFTPKYNILDISIKDIHAAVSKIVTYHSTSLPMTYKIVIDIVDGSIFIADRDDNVRTHIVDDVSIPNTSVVVSADYLIDIVAFMKKHLDGSIIIGLTDREHPLIIDYNHGTDRYLYAIAPMVDVD